MIWGGSWELRSAAAAGTHAWPDPNRGACSDYGPAFVPQPQMPQFLNPNPRCSVSTPTWRSDVMTSNQGFGRLGGSHPISVAIRYGVGRYRPIVSLPCLHANGDLPEHGSASGTGARTPYSSGDVMGRGMFFGFGLQTASGMARQERAVARGRLRAMHNNATIWTLVHVGIVWFVDLLSGVRLTLQRHNRSGGGTDVADQAGGGRTIFSSGIELTLWSELRKHLCICIELSPNVSARRTRFFFQGSERTPM
jgi:hypothetical protein